MHQEGEKNPSETAKRIEQQRTQVPSSVPLSEAKYREPITTSIRPRRR